MTPKSISFCCVVKNEEKYIHELVRSIYDFLDGYEDYEIIFVDDFSTDNTVFLLDEFSKNNKKIKLYKNIVKGKVAGTNLALKESSKSVIKFIDGDDMLNGRYDGLTIGDFDCIYHDYLELSKKRENLKKVGSWLTNNPHIIQKEFRSIPKAMFFFKSSFIKEYFPIPETLPFEDLWINFIASEAKEINYVENTFYTYRQHEEQFYGSLSNFNSKKRLRMADRFLNYYYHLQKNSHPFTFEVYPQIKHYALSLKRENLTSFIYLIKHPRLFLKSIIFNFSMLTRLLWRKK